MTSVTGKPHQPTEHDSGIGRIRERTIAVGNTLIAIDNIGSIEILNVKRNWGLARLGVAMALGGAAAMAFLNFRNPAGYGGSGNSLGQIVGMILIGVGGMFMLINLLSPLRKGLAIGTSDGRLSYVVAEDHAFLNRLLEFLTLKINTRNEGLTASFDITNTTINTNGGAAVIGDNNLASGTGGLSLGAKATISLPNNTAPPAVAASPPPEPTPAREAPIDSDETLFADDSMPLPAEAPLGPRVEQPKAARIAPAPRKTPHDPLLDGPSVYVRDEDGAGRDWPETPGRIAYLPESEGGGGSWLLPLVLLLLVAGGAVTGWYFYSQSQTSTSVSLMASPDEMLLETPAEPAAATLQSEVAPEPPAAPFADSSLVPADLPSALPTASEVEAPALPTPTSPTEVSSFTPPEVIVARSSGQRYRARPSAADDVQIIAETRAGGEALLINGRVMLEDGEWYRVALPDSRPAWFKASLAVPRSRFADTFATTAASSQSFAAASPRILEPAEGVQFGGGPQPVRLAWQSIADASIYIVEIEAYDPISKRWIEDPLHKRLTVEALDELAETFPRTGAWRWRVRGVSPAGEQSQFSRWAAFGIRD